MFDRPTDRRSIFAGAAVAALAILGAGCASSEASAAPLSRSDAEWRKKLGPDRYRILRQAGTERPFTSPLLKEHRKGTFACAGCGLPLYSSATKFESGTGWPSFWKALPNAVAHKTDRSMLMTRVEEHCARCGGHLGHVFDDGPRPTGKRHCINGLSLTFRPA